jgi:hypothetical protein
MADAAIVCLCTRIGSGVEDKGSFGRSHEPESLTTGICLTFDGSGILA